MLSKGIFTLLLLAGLTDNIYAQPLKGYCEFAGTIGAISGNEINFGGDKTPIIYHLASSDLVDCKYFVSNGFAIGLAAGVQRFSGEINRDWAYGVTSVYSFKQVTVTIAPEITYLYYKRKGFQSYGSFGAGISYFHQNRTYEPNSTESDRFASAGYIPNMNFTALGLRFGTSFSFFAEVGYGYKGIINGGLSYRFNCRKHSTPALHSSYPAKVIYLPYGEIDTNKMDYLGAVKSGSPRYVDKADFDTQLKIVTDKALAKGGNALRLFYIEDRKHSGRYDIKGTAWRALDFDSLYTQRERAKNNAFISGNCAYVIIYSATNFFPAGDIFLNDKTRLQLRPDTKMIIKLTKEGLLSFSTNDHMSEARVDATFGHYYYVKANQLNGHNNITTVSNMQGEIESSLVVKKEDVAGEK